MLGGSGAVFWPGCCVAAPPSDAELNEAKKILANAATAMAHGEAAAAEAAETARRVFEEGGAGESLPSIDVPRSELEAGVALFQLLNRAGLCASNGEARRLIKQGGARVNDEPVKDEMRQVSLNDLGDDGAVKLSAGRKKHALVRAVG